MSNQFKLFLVSGTLLITSLITLFFGLREISFRQPRSLPLPSSSVLGQSQQASPLALLVSRVIDGDTLEVSSGMKVRLIGVDTPETVDPRRVVGCFGKEASIETRRITQGKEVILEKDISETDKYGRLLRYVYIKLDDKDRLFLNDYLIREGFGRVLTYPPDVKYAARFLAAEKEARAKKRGLWAKCED